MAAAQCISSGGRSIGHAPPTRPRFISADLVPRTIYFPPGLLRRIEADRPPGALVELLTVLLSEHLKGGRP